MKAKHVLLITDILNCNDEMIQCDKLLVLHFFSDGFLVSFSYGKCGMYTAKFLMPVNGRL